MTHLIEYRINNGLPCLVMAEYYAGTNHPINSASEIPNDPEELEITLLDRKGRRAQWMDKYFTERDEREILKRIREDHTL